MKRKVLIHRHKKRLEHIFLSLINILYHIIGLLNLVMPRLYLVYYHCRPRNSLKWLHSNELPLITHYHCHTKEEKCLDWKTKARRKNTIKELRHRRESLPFALEQVFVFSNNPRVHKS